jgi:hypothetical protein
MRAIICLIASLAVPTSGWAQDPPSVVSDEAKKEVAERVAAESAATTPDGWDFSLSLGANTAFGHNSAVVGSQDGTTLQLGVLIDGVAEMRRGQHLWTTKLKISHTQTQTPELGEFVKSADELDLRTTYLFSLAALPWMGPFARARLNTALFNGTYLATSSKRFVVEGGDAPVTGVIGDGERLALTDPLQPLLLRQTAGAMGTPIKGADLTVTGLLGLGAQEIYAEGGRVIDKEDANRVVLKELHDSTQVGLEVELGVAGLWKSWLTWSAGFNVLYPFVVDADTDLEGAELINYELDGKLSFKLSKWASVDYVATIKRIPLVVNKAQIQNNLLLNASFNLL